MMTEAEFVDKIDYEGGVCEAILGYGLKPGDCEPGAVAALFHLVYDGLMEVKPSIEALENWISAHMDDEEA